MADRDNGKAVRILVLVVALIAMIALGITTPSARATLSSRLIVFAFCFTLAIVMVTTIALIPSPPDPRELRHRIFGSTKDDLDRNGLLVHKQISSQDGCASQVWSRETLRLSTAALLNYADHRAGSVWKAARKGRYFLPAARYRPR